jgi:hypothetical protein
MKALAKGKYVRHDQYGFGCVKTSDAERTMIDFDDHGEKLFVTELLNVELAGNAPEDSRSAKRLKKASAPRRAAARR